MHSGIILIGPLGAGKDYLLEAMKVAFQKQMQITCNWQVGWYYYEVVAALNNCTPQYILENKPKFRDELQKIGSTQSYVEAGVAWTVNLYKKMVENDVIPIVIGRREDEVLALQELGAFVIFIHVSEEERVQRILKRDGKIPTVEQLKHPVEPTFKKFEKIANTICYNAKRYGTLECHLDSVKTLHIENNTAHWQIPLARGLQ